MDIEVDECDHKWEILETKISTLFENEYMVSLGCFKCGKWKTQYLKAMEEN